MRRRPAATMITTDGSMEHGDVLRKAIAVIDRMLADPDGILNRRIPDFERGQFHDDHMRRLTCASTNPVDAIHLSLVGIVILKFHDERGQIDSAIEFPYRRDMKNDARGTLKVARKVAEAVLATTTVADDESVSGTWQLGLSEIARNLGSEWTGVTMPTPWSRLEIADDDERYALLPHHVRMRIERACPRLFTIGLRQPTEQSPGIKVTISTLGSMHPDPNGSPTDPIHVLRSVETVLRLSDVSPDELMATAA